MSNRESLELAGVPVVVRSPTNIDKPAPLIVLWHGFGVPNSEEILAKTLPLENVESWKAYVGLPLFGKRLPEGGEEEIMHRQLDDYVLKLLLPVIEQAVQELPEVVKALQEQYNINRDSGIGLFGFSAGGFAALLALLESKLPISAAVLAGITKDLVAAVDTFERGMKEYYPTLKEQYPWVEEKHKKYAWSSESETAKQRLDFIARSPEIATRNPLPSVLFLHGVQDTIWSLSDAEKLYAALVKQYEQSNQKKLSLQTFEHLGHNINLEAAKDKPELSQDIAALQESVANWFSKSLK